MNIHLICVGKLKERFYREAAEEYQKRLGAFCRLTVTELPEERLPDDPSRAQIDAALSREARSIRSKLPRGAFVTALCIEGKPASSEDVAALLRDFETAPDKALVFLMGGSYGLEEALKEASHRRLSMSPMTFPHHLARVMLLEQLYRGFQINGGSRYHK